MSMTARIGNAITQFFDVETDKKARNEAKNTYTITSDPSKKMLKVVSASGVKNVLVLRHLEYETAVWAVKPTTAKSTQGIGVTVNLFGYTAQGVPVSLWNIETKEKLAPAKTDKNGLANFTISSEKPLTMNVVAGLGENYAPLFPTTNPFADIQTATFWYVVVKATALNDKWPRYIGRSYGEPLPHKFWVEKPETVLGILGVKTTFADLVPAFGPQSLYYEVGISAYCNTADPFPSKEECCKPENSAWWDVKVYATNKQEEVNDVLQGRKGFIGGDKINLDYHVRYIITPTGITFGGRYLVKRRCPWEV